MFSHRGAQAGGRIVCILQRVEAFSCTGSGHLRSALIFMVFLGTADLNLTEQSLKMGRAANSQDFIASSVVFLKSPFLESCD